MNIKQAAAAMAAIKAVDKIRKSRTKSLATTIANHDARWDKKEAAILDGLDPETRAEVVKELGE